MLYFILDFILTKILKLDDYKGALESYIEASHPKTTGDVERLEREFTTKLSKGFLQ